MDKPLPTNLVLEYEVSAKVETLRLDGDTAYVFHGKLKLAGGDGEPLSLALNVPESFWNNTQCGETLKFVETS